MSNSASARAQPKDVHSSMNGGSLTPDRSSPESANDGFFALEAGAPAAISAGLDQAAIVAITDADGRIIHCNDLFCQISGYSRAELIGADHRIVNSGAHGPEVFADLYRTIHSGRIWRGTLCNRRKDGALYWVDTTIVPQLDADGSPRAFTAIRFDVTSHKKALAQARAATETALNIRDEVVANMSHDLRTPLNGVVGVACALAQTELTPRQGEMVDLIIRSGNSLTQALSDILDLSVTSTEPARGGPFQAERPIAPAPEPPPVRQPAQIAAGQKAVRVLLAEDHPVNRKVVDLLLSPIGADLTMAEDGLAAVEQFRNDQFDLILMDIQMPNMDGLTAIRQMRQIETFERRRRTPIAVLTANTSNEHRRQAIAAGADIFIAKPVTADSLMAGIEALLRLQTERAETPAVNAPVEVHTAPPADPGAECSIQQNVANLPDHSLLLVDDDRTLGDLLARQLRARGFEVTVVDTVEEALVCLRRAPPAFAVLDLHLADGSGLQICEALIGLRRESRVLFLSGYGDTATAVAAVKRGATDYLLKPTPADDVVSALLAAEGERPEPPMAALSPALVRWEHIQKVLKECDGHISQTAHRLKMHRRTLQRILSRGTPR